MRGTAAFVVARTLGALLSILGTPLILSALGREAFGLWAVIGSTVSYIGLLDLGLSQTFTRFLTEQRALGDDDEASRIVAFGALAYLTLGVLALTVAIAFGERFLVWLGTSPALVASAQTALVAMAGYFVVSSIAGVVRSILDASMHIELGQWIMAVGNFAYWGVGIALVLAGWGLRGLAMGALANAFVLLVGGLFAVRKYWAGILAWRGLPDRSRMRILFRYGAGIQVASVASTVNAETDRLVIAKFVGVGDVAGYELANTVSNAIRILPRAVLNAALPVASEWATSDGTGALRKSVRDATRVFSAATFGVSGLAAAVAPPLFVAWLGSPQPVSVAVLTVLVFGSAALNSTGVATTVLRALGTVRMEAVFTATMTLVNIAMTILLVRPFGILGVVGGTTAGSIVGSALLLVLFARREGLPVLGHVWEGLGAAACASLASACCVRLLLPLFWSAEGLGRGQALLPLAASGVLYTILWTLSSLAVRSVKLDDLRRIRGRMSAMSG